MDEKGQVVELGHELGSLLEDKAVAIESESLDPSVISILQHKPTSESIPVPQIINSGSPPAHNTTDHSVGVLKPP